MRHDGQMSAPSSNRQFFNDLNWETTPIGPRSGWPTALENVVQVVLNSPFPMFLVWGSERTLVYNDAYVRILGDLHPAAMGRPFFEVWPDVRATVEPIIDAAEAGQESYFEDLPVQLRRHGRLEQAWFTFSYSPVVDEDGRIPGALCICMETTKRVLLERRNDFLLQLSDALRSLDDPRDIISVAQRRLGEVLDANRVGYGDVEQSGRYFTTLDNWTNGVPARHGTHDLAGFGPDIHEALKRGEPLVVRDVSTDPRTSAPAFVAAFDAIETRAAITASLVRGGRMVAALYVHTAESRRWSQLDALLVQDVAERTWAEVARARAEAQASASEERYRRVFEQTNDLILTADLEQTITDCNPAAAEAVGIAREEAIGRKISEFISTEDFERTTSMLRQKLEAGGTTRYDVRVRGASGQPLYWEINSGLTFDEAGRPMGLHVVGRDVTERKRWERHQELLIAELNHRVKNTLAVVQSLAYQTFKGTSQPEQAIKVYEGRLSALATAHNLLTRENWDTVELRDLVEQALRPFCSEQRCKVDGPALRVAPAFAVSLTLALHELATNAQKYGALSTSGHVSVQWQVTDGWISLAWSEAEGPSVVEPTQAGFGTRMLRRVLATDLGGEVKLEFRENGLICRVRAPLKDALPHPLQSYQ